MPTKPGAPSIVRTLRIGWETADPHVERLLADRICFSSSQATEGAAPANSAASAFTPRKSIFPVPSTGSASM